MGSGRDDPGYAERDRMVWERIFAEMPDDWVDAPPSDAMLRCREYFGVRRCARLLDLGCGFGRWAHDLLAYEAVDSVTGVDYAVEGIRAASAWTDRVGCNARFVVASATLLPFRRASFDGVLAALLLDGLSRADCLAAIKELDPLLLPGAHGFFVFNPLLSSAALAGHGDNPTRGCVHVSYSDGELAELFPGWTIETIDRSAEGFRIVVARR